MSITKVKTANHEEWKELRSHYIGGSDAAAVVGLNAFSSPYALWAEKTGMVPGFAGNLATEVGTYLEDFVARKFAAVTGKFQSTSSVWRTTSTVPEKTSIKDISIHVLRVEDD